ncbi:MAG: hypothetical protein ACUVWA_09810 [Candidatus Oleimicrobiaceae bacterium]
MKLPDPNIGRAQSSSGGKSGYAKAVAGLPFAAALLFGSCACSPPRPNTSPWPVVNFGHLEKLCEWATMDGDSVVILHIYAEHPDYHWVAAPSEGIACVDDAARAAVTLLRSASCTGDTSRLRLAKGLLRFVLKLQAGDGEFYNFVDQSLNINTTSPTSRKGFGFSAARAYWALAAGYRFFRTRDSTFAAELRMRFLRCLDPLRTTLSHYGHQTKIGGRLYPRWLLQEYAADATSEFLLGLNEFLQAEQHQEIQMAARKLAEGLVAMQLEDSAPYAGAFLSWPGLWHAWGNAQTQALAALGKTLADTQMVRAAQREARQLLPRLLVEGWRRGVRIDDVVAPEEFPQIAYDIRCPSLGLLNVAEATGDTNFAVLAGLAASWLLGNNTAGVGMYDELTGRCYDGIESPLKVNRNSGAESTVEALATLVEVLHHPVARRYLTCHPDVRHQCPRRQHPTPGICRTFSNADSLVITICYDPAKLDFTTKVCPVTNGNSPGDPRYHEPD